MYLAVESVLWLSSATLGAVDQIPFAVLLLIIGGMLIHPISLMASRLAGFAQLSEANRLPILNTWLALMIPLGLPLVFMAVAGGRTNLFYPAFAVLIGVHWLPFTYIYAMKSFTVLAGLFVLIGVVFGFILNESFAVCGFVVGGVLLLFAVLNFLLVQREIHDGRDDLMSDAVSWNLHLRVRDGQLKTAKALMEEMVESTLQEPGTRGYEWFLSADGRVCHIHERYTDSDAALVHAAAFGSRFVERFLAVFEPIRLSAYGPMSPALRTSLDAFGAEYFGPLGGFSR